MKVEAIKVEGGFLIPFNEALEKIKDMLFLTSWLDSANPIELMLC